MAPGSKEETSGQGRYTKTLYGRDRAQDDDQFPEHQGSQDGKDLQNRDPLYWEAFVVGLLGGGQENYMERYVNTPHWSIARHWVLKNTRFDINWLSRGYSIFNTASALSQNEKLTSFMNFVAQASTSSIGISGRIDSNLLQAVNSWMAMQSSQNATSWMNIYGQHNEAGSNGKYQSKAAQPKRFLRFEGRLMMIEFKDLYESTTSGWGDSDVSMQNRSLLVSCFGRSDQPVREFLEYCRITHSDSNALELRTFGACDPGTDCRVRKRALDGVDMPRTTKKDISEDVAMFFSEETADLYRDVGKPFRRGWLLSGPPGTGKTSLAIALASHVNKPLAVIKLGGMSDGELDKAFQSLPGQGSCIVLIDDIDATGIIGRGHVHRAINGIEGADSAGTGKVIPPSDDLSTVPVADLATAFTLEPRSNQSTKIVQHSGGVRQETGDKSTDEPDKRESALDKEPRRVTGVTLGALLNAIDGAGAAEGRLLIMTTNAPKSLDKALYRKGRIDRQLEMGYSDKETAELTFRRLMLRDPSKRFTTQAVERFAKTFAAQFPKKTKITPAVLTYYLFNMIGRPQEAIKNFPEFLRRRKTGEDDFTYDINDDVEVEDDEDEVEDYDEHDLDSRPEDLLPCMDVERQAETEAIQKSTSEPRSVVDLLDAGYIGYFWV